MKYTALLVLLLNFFTSSAQNCKPDLTTTDKITKQGNIAWETTLFESGFGNSLVNTSDWFITAQFGRYGENNLFTLFISKYEESAQNAAFESQYQGQKGQDVYLAFTQGEPLKLTVGSASTRSQMNNMLGKLVTTVTLCVTLTPEQIGGIKKAFDGGTLNAIRIGLANNMHIEKDVKEKKAKKLTEKVQCFLDYNEKNPVKAPEIANIPQVGSDVPENLPRDNSNKITFEEAITVDGATKDQLFQRAKSWMINYYKNEQLSVNNAGDGQLIRSGSFIKVYKKPNGGTESDNHIYNISVLVKDGKYKYSITDMVLDDGKEKMTVEAAYDLVTAIKNEKYKRYVDQQIYTGITDVIKNLKTAMATDAKAKSDW